MYASSYNIDPHSEVVNRFACKNIPTPANSGAGFNYNRFCDPAVDKIIDEAGSTVDPERRKQLYGQVFQRVNDEVLNVWIYNRADIDGFRVNVSGAKAHPWSSITWNTQDWFKRP
jgi:peptide/nickel transport system substrate-binding protein